jgi:glutamate 5-kinase
MKSKLRAARLVTTAGESVIIANGAAPNVLDDIMAGQTVGTLFLPHGGTLPSWKRWIGMTAQPQGHYVVDAGARKAVQEQGRSLLAIGVVEIKGDFSKGDVVSIIDKGGIEFGRGLTNYSAAEAAKIKGMRSEQIAELLGARTYAEVIHRDNLVITI